MNKEINDDLLETSRKHMAAEAKTVEKTTKAPKGNPEALKEAAAARASAQAKDRFTYKGEPTKKLPPQAQTIVNVIKAEPKGYLRDDLVAALKGVLVTRQPEGRILSYYQKLLVETGAIEIAKSGA